MTSRAVITALGTLRERSRSDSTEETVVSSSAIIGVIVVDVVVGHTRVGAGLAGRAIQRETGALRAVVALCALVASLRGASGRGSVGRLRADVTSAAKGSYHTHTRTGAVVAGRAREALRRSAGVGHVLSDTTVGGIFGVPHAVGADRANNRICAALGTVVTS